MVIFAFAAAKLVQTMRKNKYICNFMSFRRNIPSSIALLFPYSHTTSRLKDYCKGKGGRLLIYILSSETLKIYPTDNG